MFTFILIRVALNNLQIPSQRCCNNLWKVIDSVKISTWYVVVVICKSINVIHLDLLITYFKKNLMLIGFSENLKLF